MVHERVLNCVLQTVVLFCVLHLTTGMPQSDGTIHREGLDLQKCGVPKISLHSRMVLSDVAIEHKWPWHGGLFHLDEYKCGCTLINELFVLTASHCVHNSETEQKISEKKVRVKLGMHYLSKNDSGSVQLFTVRKIITHSKFVPYGFKHDVALLRLNTTVQYSQYVQPICLDPTETIWVEYLADMYGTVVGWGLNERDKVSDYLLQAELPIVRYTDCVESNPDLYGRFIYSGMYCAGLLNGTSPCNGDSGGGMYFFRGNRWFLRGVVSFSGIRPGTNYCDAFSYVVFMNVPYYVKWINEEVDAARDELQKASAATVELKFSNRFESDVDLDNQEKIIFALRKETEEESFSESPQIEKEEPIASNHTVRCGENVTLSCKTSPKDDQNTTRWYKVEHGERKLLIQHETLTYQDVHYENAGEYWCQVTNDSDVLYEKRIHLSVTQVPIRFHQVENVSYAVYDVLMDNLFPTQFSFEMTFRMNASNAVLFHKPSIPGAKSWSYTLQLERDHLAFRVVAPGQLVNVFRSVKLQLEPTRWHTVLISSYDGNGLMALDGQYLMGFESHLLQHRSDRYYIANAPELNTAGLSGCVSRLMINDKVLDLDRDFIERINVEQCNWCNSQECNTDQCPEAQQHSCINDVCSQGRCDGSDVLSSVVDCDLDLEPYPQGLRFQHNSYASYRSFLDVTLTVDLKFQLHNASSGIVLHVSEHPRGFGKFITILVKEERMELRFATDAHLHTIYLESSITLMTGRWYRLQAGYQDGYVYLQVDDEEKVTWSVQGTMFDIGRQLVVFVGGVRWQGFINRHRDLKQGLDGCINELKLSRVPVDLVNDMIEYANIRSCQEQNVPVEAHGSESPIETEVKPHDKPHLIHFPADENVKR